MALHIYEVETNSPRSDGFRLSWMEYRPGKKSDIAVGIMIDPSLLRRTRRYFLILVDIVIADRSLQI